MEIFSIILVRGMTIRIVDNIYYVGVDDTTSDLFEGIWPIPNGVSYNAYLILGDKKVLIEGGVKKAFSREFFNNVEELISLEDIDYIVVNHMEPDHSGTLPELLRINKKAKIYITPFGSSLLKNFYGFESKNRVITVRKGDTLDLGDRKLVFIPTPGVHWPDSMATYETKNKILFSSDAFGTFGALNGRIFDDQIDLNYVLGEARRYFANIIGKFSSRALQVISEIEKMDIEIIAPSHGPIWRKKPKNIIDYYKKLSMQKPDEKILVVCGSMYGFTREAIAYITRRLAEERVRFSVIDPSRTHPSYFLSEAWDSKIVVFGSPTYDGDIFPPVRIFLSYIQIKTLKNRYFGIIGSCGWAGGGYRKIVEILKNMNWELIEPIVEFKGRITSHDYSTIEQLISNIKHVLSV